MQKCPLGHFAFTQFTYVCKNVRFFVYDKMHAFIYARFNVYRKPFYNGSLDFRLEEMHFLFKYPVSRFPCRKLIWLFFCGKHWLDG